MRRATIRQLQVFVEAARLLSFARVSERLHLTPAAVSFQIKQLESISGSPLFERIGKRVRQTDAGRLLLGYAEMIINALGDADQVLASFKGLRGGRVGLDVGPRCGQGTVRVPRHLSSRGRQAATDGPG